MVTKKFILPGLALGAMLIESTPIYAQTPSIDLENSPSSGIKSIQINGGSTGTAIVFKSYDTGSEPNLATVNVAPGKKILISLDYDKNYNGLFNPNSGLNHVTLAVSCTFEASNGEREIFTRENKGIYFVKVIPQHQNSLTASNSFIASSTGNQQSNLIATSLGIGSDTFLSNPLNNTRISNFYKFSLSLGQQVSITMNPHDTLAQMRVLQDASFDHTLTSNRETVNSTSVSSSQQTLTVKRPGDYYLQISQSFPVLIPTPTTDMKFQFSAVN